MSLVATCPICRIIDGDAAGLRLLEDARSLAFLVGGGLAPACPVVVPKHHAATNLGMPDEMLAAAMVTTTRLVRAIKAAYAPEEVMVMQPRGAPLGPAHLHFRLVPVDADGLNALFGDTPPTPADLEAAAQRIRAALPV